MYLKKAQMEDFDFFYSIKCDSNNMYWTGSKEIPPRERLLIFFEKCMKNKEELGGGKLIYVVVDDENNKVGYIYIDPDLENKYICDIPIGIDSEYAGRGYGKQAILLALEKAKKLGYKRMVGHIREDNIASLKLYEKCGVTISDEYIIKYLESTQSEVKMWTVYIDL